MSIQDYLIDIGLFINGVIIPFLFALALLFFLFNVARFFVLKANDSKAREQARQLAIYGILAFVFLVSIWGIVNVIASGLGIDDDNSLCPDYLDGWCSGGYSGYGGGGGGGYGNDYYDDYYDDSYWGDYSSNDSDSWSDYSSGDTGSDWGWDDNSQNGSNGGAGD